MARSDAVAWHGEFEGKGRRAKIMRAALQLFRDYGFLGASIDEIGSASGVSGPAIYYHFKDKHELLGAVFLAIGQQVFDQLDEISSSTEDPEQQLRRMVEHHAYVVVDMRRVFPILYEESRNLKRAHEERAKRRREDILTYWSRSLHAARPDLPRDVARTLAAGGIWLIHSAAYYESDIEREALISCLTESAMAAMLTPVACTSEHPRATTAD